jgi:hypothetical protein
LLPGTPSIRTDDLTKVIGLKKLHAKVVAHLRVCNNWTSRLHTAYELTMVPNLAESQHVMISDMILSYSVKYVDIAAAAGCSDRSVRAIRANMRCFGSTRAPFNGAGRPRLITQ